jgi:hypothetical protein
LAYFRIPEFREAFLKCLEESSNFRKPIPEWQDVDQKEVEKDVKLRYFKELFNWEEDFYAPIKDQTRNE